MSTIESLIPGSPFARKEIPPPPTADLSFREFPKMARLSREVVITEKIDGTNACVFIGPNGEFLTGSRTRWITPQDDNFGFSRWAHDHKDELMTLGPGRHFGEWWGSGIQRGYGLPKGERRFSLFNVLRWHEDIRDAAKYSTPRPSCCGVVPVLYRDTFSTVAAEAALMQLRDRGSRAAPGFMDPEGIVAFHVAGNVGFKKTLKNDDVPKGRAT